MHLRWRAYVEHSGPLPEVEVADEIAARHRAVRLELMSREALEGEVLSTLAPEYDRMLSLLNGGERFLLLVTSDSAIYSNRDALLQVSVL